MNNCYKLATADVTFASGIVTATRTNITTFVNGFTERYEKPNQGLIFISLLDRYKAHNFVLINEIAINVKVVDFESYNNMKALFRYLRIT